MVFGATFARRAEVEMDLPHIAPEAVKVPAEVISPRRALRGSKIWGSIADPSQAPMAKKSPKGRCQVRP